MCWPSHCLGQGCPPSRWAWLGSWCFVALPSLHSLNPGPEGGVAKVANGSLARPYFLSPLDSAWGPPV